MLLTATVAFSPPPSDSPFTKPTWNATTHDPNSISSYYCSDTSKRMVVATETPIPNDPPMVKYSWPTLPLEPPDWLVYDVPEEGGPGPKLTCFAYFSLPDWNVSRSSPYDEDAYYCPGDLKYGRVIHAKMTPNGPENFTYTWPTLPFNPPDAAITHVPHEGGPGPELTCFAGKQTSELEPASQTASAPRPTLIGGARCSWSCPVTAPNGTAVDHWCTCGQCCSSPSKPDWCGCGNACDASC